MTIYPEHEKLKALDGANQTVGDFLEWLDDHGYEIGQRDDKENYLQWTGKYRDDWLAHFFDIDRKKLSAEKDAMLEEIRASSDDL